MRTKSKVFSAKKLIKTDISKTYNMKAEELKSKIQFESRDVENITIMTGKLEVYAAMEYDRRAIEANRDGECALDEIKEKLREMIMQYIYDDQSAVLYDALMDLFKASPTDYSAISAAREKIMNAARRQKPT